ncbi:MAG: glycine cleavage system protein GcvH [Fervidobacterium pennivorans]|uniref:Glycine cleavage system H protein n=1 Tax=Fervidobacterium pennivorans TaxID=93466 RepID=A0A172T527_FERPE|nr:MULTISPECIES: glycine cleavage system protein GcvH [Fervidobacterium]ANE42064.1 glycine cleavage system protein H [Fervidobacterium pennivorans]MDM7321214.1 glycine cleavage system protein GcvH [Fervidobacterium sp.]NPU88558.1 glycine cleavage system protein GcvH [Fervidobacterium sp.]
MKKYTKTHEWIDTETGKVGVSNYAQEQLGDIVYVELPAVGKEVKKGDRIVSLESVKAAGDVYAPVSGKIVAVNEKVNATPELINQDPEGEGWLVQIEISNPAELDELLTEDEYKASL